MYNSIKKWLANSKRLYADGLDLFILVANNEMKNRYEKFFKSINASEVKPFTLHYNLLCDQLSLLSKMIKANPKAFEKIPGQEASSDNELVEKQKAEISELYREVEELQEALAEAEENSETAEELQEQLADAEDKIDELKKSLADRKIKVLAIEDLPANIAKVRLRIKEIVPLMAKLHAGLSDEHISDDERKVIAKEVCALDDERRKLWDVIDEYLAGNDAVLPEEYKPKAAVEYAADPLVRGTQITARIKRLTENIKRNNSAAEKHRKNGKPALEEKALKQAATYQDELDKLQAELDDKK